MRDERLDESAPHWFVSGRKSFVPSVCLHPGWFVRPCGSRLTLVGENPPCPRVFASWMVRAPVRVEAHACSRRPCGPHWFSCRHDKVLPALPKSQKKEIEIQVPIHAP